nr:hypothetical protein [Tanacetum cinerariifolium]
ASIRASKGRVMTTVGEVNERVIYLATTQRQNAHEFYVLHKDAQDDRALLRAQISLLKREDMLLTLILQTDGGDYDKEDESFEDDDDDEEEAFEEDEHLALADSAPLHAIDHVPLAEETKLFETDESAATPPPPQTTVLVSMTRYHMAQISVRSHTPPSLSIEALIIKIASPPLLLPPAHTSPTYAYAPLGYRAATIKLRATPSPPLPILSPPLHVPSPPSLLPFTKRRSDIPKADMPYASIRASKGRVMTTVGEVNERVIYLATTQRQNAHEFYVLHKDAQDDRALLRAQISLLKREGTRGSYHNNRGSDQSIVEGCQFRELARIRDAGRQDGPADVGSSC